MAAPTTQTFRVDGMTCGHCAGAVAAELSAIEGVLAVNVDLDAGSATVEADRELARSDVEAAVLDAGYSLRDEVLP